MKEHLSILIIEDDADEVLFLTSSLNKLKAKDIETQLRITHTLEEALQVLSDGSFDLIITDLYLPDSQGLDTFLEVQKRALSMPIIIVGGSTDEELVRETIKLGAQDYLPKADLNAELLSRIIHHAIERNRLHDCLKSLSFTDELTALYNRRGFMTLLEQQISLSLRTKKGFYLFLVDLDYLKQINDTYGHLVGDHALIDMAKCLRSSFRRHDIIARIGGDEFAVIAINVSEENGEEIKNKMFEHLEAYNNKIHQPYRIAFSVGKTYYDGLHAMSLDELLLLVDQDLYKDKRLKHSSHASE